MRAAAKMMPWQRRRKCLKEHGCRQSWSRWIFQPRHKSLSSCAGSRATISSSDYSAPRRRAIGKRCARRDKRCKKKSRSPLHREWCLVETLQVARSNRNSFFRNHPNADKNGVDLIVLGRRDSKIVGRFGEGHTSDRVMRYAKCAVLIVNESGRDFIARLNGH